MTIILFTLYRCWSYIGMIGGRQDISIAPGCTSLIPVHEIFHALGRWHEQSRPDRDNFVTINLTNVLPSKLLLLVIILMCSHCHYSNATHDPMSLSSMWRCEDNAVTVWLCNAQAADNFVIILSKTVVTTAPVGSAMCAINNLVLLRT